jgi:hypothetical protein
MACSCFSLNRNMPFFCLLGFPVNIFLVKVDDDEDEAAVLDEDASAFLRPLSPTPTPPG